MRTSALAVTWVMALITSVVMLVVTAGAIAVALTSPAGSTLQLDAWWFVVAAGVSAIVASSLLAVLTLARIRRGEPLTTSIEVERPVVVPLVVTTPSASEPRSI